MSKGNNETQVTSFWVGTGSKDREAEANRNVTTQENKLTFQNKKGNLTRTINTCN